MEDISPEKLPVPRKLVNLSWKQKLAIVLLVLISIWAGVSMVFISLWGQLQQQHEIGSGTLSVDNPVIHTPLHYSFDGIKFVNSTHSISSKRAHFKVNPFAFTSDSVALLEFYLADLEFTLQKDSSSVRPLTQGPSKQRQKLQFTDFKLPIGVHIKVDDFRLIQNQDTLVQMNHFIFTNPTSRSLLFQLESFKSVYLSENPRITSLLSWNDQDSISIDFELQKRQDILEFKGKAAKLDLQLIDGQLRLDVKNLTDWLSPQQQKSLHMIQGLKIQGTLKSDLGERDYNFDVQLQTKVNSFHRLPSIDISTTAKGNMDHFLWTLQGRGKRNEKLQFQGKVSQNQGVSFSGKTSGLYRRMTTTNTLPMNFTVHQATLINNNLIAKLTTSDGSQVNGNVNFNSSIPSGSFHASISPSESWATEWTDGNLEITGGEIDGHFKNGIMVAHVVSSTPNAYGFAAENVDVNLKLEKDGIYFWNSKIQKRGIPLDFSGRVTWLKSEAKYQFEIHSPYQENAPQDNLKIYGDHESNLHVTASNFDLIKIPLRDTTIYQQRPGILTGYYHNNFNSKQGNATLYLKSKIDQQDVSLRVNALLSNDTLTLDSSEIEMLNNKLGFSAKMKFDHTLNDSAFYPYEFHLTPEKFNLNQLSHLLPKDIIQSGKVKGGFHYSNGTFKDSLILQNFTLTTFDSNQFIIPSLRIIGQDSSIQISGRAHLGINDEWDGEFEVLIQNAFLKTKKVEAAFIPLPKLSLEDLESEIVDDSYLSISLQSKDLKNIEGNITAHGKWALPNQFGIIDSLHLHGPIFWNIEQGFKGLNFRARNSRLMLRDSDIPIDAMKFDSKILQGKLKISSNLYDSLKQKADMQLIFNLSESKLEQFSVNAAQYHIDIDSIQAVNFKDVKAQLFEENSVLAIKFTSPYLNYLYLDSSDGQIRASLKDIDGVYTIPLDKKGNKTYQARVQADSKIASLIYEKNDFNKDFIDLGFNSYNSLFTQKKIRKKKKIEKRPIELNINIEDSGQDSLYVKTNLTEFPITANMQVTGTTSNPIFSGGIFATAESKLKFHNYIFDIQQLGVNWDRKAPYEGVLQSKLFKEIPYCVKNEGQFEESCPIDISIEGTLENPQLRADANCGSTTELDTRKLFSSLTLGCISEEDEGSFVNAVVDRFLSRGAKKLSDDFIRADLIEDLQLHRSENNEIDSNSVEFITKIPFFEKSDQLKDFRLKGQFVWDAQTEGEYSDFQMLGLEYIFFDSLSSQTGQLEDGRLTAGGNIINKEYLDLEEAQRSEQQVEWNAGIQYQNTFWGDFTLPYLNPIIMKEPEEAQ